MEDTSRWVALTAIAPVAWGTNYYVTRQFLPPGTPLYGAVFRALPAGLLLLAVRRQRPRGSWWWKSLVLGSLNMGGFFALIYVAAQRLPTSVASIIMATSPVAMMLVAWLLVAERPRMRPLAGAGVGVGGVALMLSGGAAGIDPVGVVASVTAMMMSSFGFVLAKRWGAEVDVLASTAWQLIAGGVLLIPLAALVHGAPPHLDATALLAFAYVTVAATAIAFAAWFTGLRHLRASTVGLVGLLNPVTGVLLGFVVAAEGITVRKAVGIMLVLAGILFGRAFAGRRPSAAVQELSPARSSRRHGPELGPAVPRCGNQQDDPDQQHPQKPFEDRADPDGQGEHDKNDENDHAIGYPARCLEKPPSRTSAKLTATSTATPGVVLSS